MADVDLSLLEEGGASTISDKTLQDALEALEEREREVIKLRDQLKEVSKMADHKLHMLLSVIWKAFSHLNNQLIQRQCTCS